MVEPAQNSPASVLVADAEATWRREAARVLVNQGHQVLTAESPEAALSLVRTAPVDVALVALGLATPPLLEALRRQGAELLVLASAPIEPLPPAVEAASSGILEKTPSLGVLAPGAVRLALERRRLRSELARRSEAASASLPPLLGDHRLLRRALQLARSAAAVRSTVCIEGEPGTGKELLARHIHAGGPRSGGPFIAVSCLAQRPDELGRQLGLAACPPAPDTLLAAAQGGTLFLEDIEALSPAIQYDLLGLLQRCDGCDTRLIVAVTRNLFQLVRDGAIRRDLFARLSVISIHLPPLRQRRDDIPLLAHQVLRVGAQRAGCVMKRISPEAMRFLRNQDWPGNVRELEVVLERAVVLSQGETLFPGDISMAIHSENHVQNEAPVTTKNEFSGLALAPGWDELPYADAKDRALDAFHAAYLGALLRRTGGNISEAARRAGLDRSNFRRVLKRYGNPLAPKTNGAQPAAAAAPQAPSPAIPAGGEAAKHG